MGWDVSSLGSPNRLRSGSYRIHANSLESCATMSLGSPNRLRSDSSRIHANSLESCANLVLTPA
jgi:hypothetical protein